MIDKVDVEWLITLVVMIWLDFRKKKSPQIVNVVENRNDKRAVKGEGNLS